MVTYTGVALEVAAGHLHGLARQPPHGPLLVQAVAVVLLGVPALLGALALVPATAPWADEAAQQAGWGALALTLVGLGVHLEAAWAKGPGGWWRPLLLHDPPFTAPALSACLLYLAARSRALAREGLPPSSLLPALSAACAVAGASAAIEHLRLGWKPLPWTLWGPAAGAMASWEAWRLSRWPSPTRCQRQGFLLALLALGVAGAAGVAFHRAGQVARHGWSGGILPWLVKPPLLAPASLVLLAAWGLYALVRPPTVVWVPIRMRPHPSSPAGRKEGRSWPS
jgi:hypothetical protein